MPGSLADGHKELLLLMFMEKWAALYCGRNRIGDIGKIRT